jgi:DNA-binding CsgD family transcriptional regulator
MINISEITQNITTPQIAGLLPSDFNKEFIAIRDTKKVVFLCAGQTHYFSDLPLKDFNLIKSAYLKDHNAVSFISKIHEDLKDQIEFYTYHIWGDLDSIPDIENGVLSDSENFRDQKNCPSLLWNSKTMKIDNYILNPRELSMIDMMAQDYKDIVIAGALHISVSHYDGLKRKLFKATNTQTKTSLVLKAKDQKVI